MENIQTPGYLKVSHNIHGTKNLQWFIVKYNLIILKNKILCLLIGKSKAKSIYIFLNATLASIHFQGCIK